ncbi:MAG TPA: DNA polymerase ligase N-terminal domain-containing protein [Spirochaetota bacterium]|nr:DNA polymerase ligase N-terminal domain-containing protein [Spirochaetota bacterium]
MKFVVHHHTSRPGEADHYDLMIDGGGALATWRISEESMARLLQGDIVVASKIADHRREYLSYEGPVSCDRGMVKIMDSGECEMADHSESARRYRMKGKELKGMMLISLLRGDRWEILLTPG